MNGVVAGGGIAGGHELADSVIFEEFLGLVGVDGVELFGAVGAGVDEDAVGAAGMVFEEAGAVVDVAVDDDPGGFGRGVFLDLGDGVHF